MSHQASMFSCDSCGRSFKWKAELAGRHVKCKCGEALVVPAEEPAAPLRSTSETDAIDNAADANPNVMTSDAESDTAVTEEKDDVKFVSPLGIGIAVLFVLLIAYTTYRYVYKFTASPTIVTTAAQAAELSDGDFVQMDLPLADEGQIVTAKVGGDNYLIIHFIDTKGVSLCIEDPSDNPYADIPATIIGRVNTQTITDNWRVYGRSLDFGFHKDTKLITLELPPAPNDWFVIFSVVGLLYLLGFLKELIFGSGDAENENGDAGEQATEAG